MNIPVEIWTNIIGCMTDGEELTRLKFVNRVFRDVATIIFNKLFRIKTNIKNNYIIIEIISNESGAYATPISITRITYWRKSGSQSNFSLNVEIGLRSNFYLKEYFKMKVGHEVTTKFSYHRFRDDFPRNVKKIYNKVKPFMVNGKIINITNKGLIKSSNTNVDSRNYEKEERCKNKSYYDLGGRLYRQGYNFYDPFTGKYKGNIGYNTAPHNYYCKITIRKVVFKKDNNELIKITIPGKHKIVRKIIDERGDDYNNIEPKRIVRFICSCSKCRISTDPLLGEKVLKLITTDKIFRPLIKIFNKERKLFGCYQRLKTYCYRCEKWLTMPYVTAEGEQWHMKCHRRTINETKT